MQPTYSLLPGTASVVCITHDGALAEAILNEYTGPITGHQIRTIPIRHSKATEWTFDYLSLEPLQEVLERVQGDYSLETLEGYLLFARERDLVFLTA